MRAAHATRRLGARRREELAGFEMDVVDEAGAVLVASDAAEGARATAAMICGFVTIWPAVARTQRKSFASSRRNVLVSWAAMAA